MDLILNLNNILLIMILAPLIGSILLLILPLSNDTSKIIALNSSLFSFVLSVLLFMNFNKTDPQFQFINSHIWGTGFQKHEILLGIDVISLFFIILTTLIFSICFLASWNIKNFIKEYFIAFLVMESLLLLVFSILDLLNILYLINLIYLFSLMHLIINLVFIINFFNNMYNMLLFIFFPMLWLYFYFNLFSIDILRHSLINILAWFIIINFIKKYNINFQLWLKNNTITLNLIYLIIIFFSFFGHFTIILRPILFLNGLVISKIFINLKNNNIELLLNNKYLKYCFYIISLFCILNIYNIIYIIDILYETNYLNNINNLLFNKINSVRNSDI